MKSLLTISGAMLCGLVMMACIAGEQPQTGDPSSTEAANSTSASGQGESSDSLTITPRACFIEGFCAGSPVIGHPSYCIHTRPCAAGEALDLAQAFCRNRCGGDCSAGNIIHLVDCP